MPQSAEAKREWRAANPEKQAAYAKNESRRRQHRWSTDHHERSIHHLQVAFQQVRKQWRSAGIVMGSPSSYGLDFRRYIEELGPCPDPATHTVGFHRLPNSFDLADPAQVVRAFGPSNLRWREGRRRKWKFPAWRVTRDPVPQ